MAPDERFDSIHRGTSFDEIFREGQAIDAERGVPPRMRAARRALYDRVFEPLAVARVASHLALDPSKLSRQFASAFAISPRDYRRRVRIQVAVPALIGGMSIAQTALRAGYRDLSRFTTVRPFHGRNTGSLSACDRIKRSQDRPP